MAELTQSLHHSPQICPLDEEIARMFQNFGLKDIRPQQPPIASPSTKFFCASTSSSSPYYLQNSSPINGGFPAQSWNNGGFSSQLWNTGGNAVDNVDWSYCDTPCKFVKPCALPSIGNYERFGRINSPVSSWNNYSTPSTRFNGAVSTWNDVSYPDTVCTTDFTEEGALEAYNMMQIAKFKKYLKLKGWTEEHTRNFERCDNPILLDECYGLDIHMMCTNQLGSMYLQKVMQRQQSATSIILNAVLKGIFWVISDPNGYYVFQKLLDLGSREQLQTIVYAITKRDASRVFIDAAMTQNGTKSIQKLITTLKSHKPLMKNVINSLKPHVFELMITQWGRRLIDYCMRLPNYDQTKFIYEAVVLNCLVLSRHKEGYLVVSKAIDTIQDPYRIQLLTLLTDHAVHLAQDPNGNFVLQKVIELENPIIIFNLCFNLKEKVVPVSKTKYGSRVIEKCLKSSPVIFVVREILSSKQLTELARNEFGNYVLQRTLENLKDKHHELFMELLGELRALSKLLENHPTGRMVLRRMRELEPAP